MHSNPFYGRHFTVAGDLSRSEILYLFTKISQLKSAFAGHDQHTLNSFKINDSSLGLYEIFSENSTRTKNSFANAAEFHKIKHIPFDAPSSSFTKQESWEDTVNTLIGYNNRIFVIRTELEGVCRWLANACSAYSQRNHLPAPIFINAGDGKHEHPTQELLDEFTFWEDNQCSTSHIHIALVGDLLHGRTAHSKAHGLNIFDEVEVDLIAPHKIQMPQNYLQIMRHNGFKVRLFSSIEEYLQEKSIAPKWYFTRPQLERLGDDLKPLIAQLRQAIIFKKEYINQLPPNSCFYHPFPRYKPDPTLPSYLDQTNLNAYERQSRNGYFTRIVLLAALVGKIGYDFKGEILSPPVYLDDFIHPISVKNKRQKQTNEGINPIHTGTVIDHICQGDDKEDLWEHLNKIRQVMGFSSLGYVGVAKSRDTAIVKGLVFLPNFIIDEPIMKKLAAVAPGCTVNLIKNNRVIVKLRLNMPPRIYGLDQIACKNDNCISNPKYFERVIPEFIRQDETFICSYCDKVHTYKQIWK